MNRRRSAFIKLPDPKLNCPGKDCCGWLMLFGVPANQNQCQCILSAPTRTTRTNHCDVLKRPCSAKEKVPCVMLVPVSSITRISSPILGTVSGFISDALT